MHRPQPTCILLLAAMSSACADRPPDGAPLDDAGADARLESTPGVCILNTICDGDSVRACESGRGGALLEVCRVGSTCSLGRCTSPACAAVEQAQGFLGCLFYATRIDNVDADDQEPMALLVTSSTDLPASVWLERREPGGSWTVGDSTVIDPFTTDPYPMGGAATLAISGPHLEGDGTAPALAVRLASDTPVRVTAIQSDDATERATSSAGTLLLPAHALGRDHLAMTFPQSATPRVLAVPGSRRGAGQIVVVGTQDRTVVTIEGSATTTVGRRNITLDDGDVYQLYSDPEHPSDDLCGTSITSDKPIAVFSGNISTTYGQPMEGQAATGINSADMAGEQMLPVRYWGTSYVAAWLPPQQSVCDSLFDKPGSSVWRVLASQNDTHVAFETQKTMVSGLLPQGVTLDRGEVVELTVSGGADFVVTANRPIFVAQGMDCEATLAGAVGIDAWLDDFLFLAPRNFDHHVAIVRPMGSNVKLDNQLVDTLPFSPVGRGLEVAHVVFPPCRGSASACVHRIRGRFGVTLRGMDVVCSYASTAPTWTKCSDVMTPGCVE